MKEFIFTVPYTETVTGITTFIVEAESLDDATDKLNKESYMYYHDSEQESSDAYEELWGDISLKQVKELS